MKKQLALFGVLLFLLGAVQRLEAASYSESAVKAAFLHRFAAYVEWPAGALGEGPFTIAVVGADGVLDELRHLLPELTIQNRPAQARAASSVADLQDAHILYIGPGNLARAGALVRAAATRPILIVTDDPAGLAGGGIINFVPVERNLRLEVSLTAANRIGLKINSGLLAVAIRVDGRPQAGLDCLSLWVTAGYGNCFLRFATRSRIAEAPPEHLVILTKTVRGS